MHQKLPKFAKNYDKQVLCDEFKMNAKQKREVDKAR